PRRHPPRHRQQLGRRLDRLPALLTPRPVGACLASDPAHRTGIFYTPMTDSLAACGREVACKASSYMGGGCRVERDTSRPVRCQSFTSSKLCTASNSTSHHSYTSSQRLWFSGETIPCSTDMSPISNTVIRNCDRRCPALANSCVSARRADTRSCNRNVRPI